MKPNNTTLTKRQLRVFVSSTQVKAARDYLVKFPFRPSFWVEITSAVFLCGVFILLVITNTQKPLDHDEHQFIAAGMLIAKEHSLPYLDYAYFHMPNLAFIYAALFTVTDYLLLSSRLFSTLCTWLLLVIIFVTAYRLFRNRSKIVGLLMAICSVLLLLINPLFVYTTGKAWNHDLPVLLITVAFFLYFEALKREKRRWWFFACGACVGLAVGTRLTFAPVVLPFLLMFFLMPHQQGRKDLVSSILPFMLGLLVSLLPSLSLFALAPKQFLFGNFTYAAYNTLFRQQQGFGMGEINETTMTLFGKLSFLARTVLIHPNTGFLIIAMSFFLIQFYRDRKKKLRFNLEVVFSLTLLFFLLIGSLAPTPTWYQYFYAPLPFLMIALLYGMSAFTEQEGRRRWITFLVVPILFITISFGVKFYQNLALTLSPAESLAVRIHTAGRELASRVGNGRVLSLAPIFPLEGGASIYEEFATGSFGWRVAPLIPIEERLEVGLVADSDLQKLLQLKPPAAILTGYEASLEQAFVQIAKELDFRPVKLTADKKLWLAPP